MAIQIDNKRILTGTMYAPFCRTMHVPMEEWDGDMENMAKLGFTCVHGFAEWHDIEYEKGHYDFTKIDYMVACAVKHGIVPIINIATQNSVGFYSPRWLMEECRGKSSGFIDAEGNAMWQGQYIVPCIDDPIYQSYAQRFLKETAKHFAGDERIGGYVLWGEPTLFRPGTTSPICYCEHTTAKFRIWLKEKYKTIDRLNEAWATEGPTDFVDFSAVYPPTGSSRQLGGFVSWDDFRTFMEENLADHVRTANQIFKANGATQPTIVEMMTGVHNAIDLWLLSECVDIVGVSCFDRPGRNTAMYMSMADSMAKALGKTMFIVEAGGGSTKYMWWGPQSPSADELKMTMLQRIAYGAKGIMYWCYRPRISDTEGNDFGMTRPDGKVLKRTKELAKTANAVTKASEFFQNSEHKSHVVIFSSQKVNHLMQAEFMEDRYLSSIEGAAHLFNDLHINTDFICEKQICAGGLQNYKLLILPCSYIMSEACAKKIAEFVKAGGNVIADSLLAEKKPGGNCYVTLPGGGLDKVFGFEQEDMLAIEHPSQILPNKPGVIMKDFRLLVEPTDAQVVEEYEKGEAYVLKNYYGKGTASYLATVFFSSYKKAPTLEHRKTIRSLLSGMEITSHCALKECDEAPESPVLITTAMYRAENGELSGVLVSHPGYETVCDTLILPKGSYRTLEAEDDVVFVDAGEETHVQIELGPWQNLFIMKIEECQ